MGGLRYLHNVQKALFARAVQRTLAALVLALRLVQVRPRGRAGAVGRARGGAGGGAYRGLDVVLPRHVEGHLRVPRVGAHPGGVEGTDGVGDVGHPRGQFVRAGYLQVGPGLGQRAERVQVVVAAGLVGRRVAAVVQTVLLGAVLQQRADGVLRALRIRNCQVLCVVWGG